MNKINFKDKHIRYGGYGALLTLLLIAITITINVLITHLNIKLDTTSEHIYSLSDTTKTLAASINDPINIYVLEETGKETKWLQEFLQKYPKLNNNIKIIYKDPILYPAFSTSYLKKNTQNLNKIDERSLIIENATTGKFKIIPPSEFVKAGTSSNSSDSAITVESAVTNGIGYVLTDKDGTIYYTTGHNELELSSYFISACNNASLENKSIDLLKDEMPDPSSSIIVINSPHSDFTKPEVDKLIDFMNEGGKAMVFMDADIAPLPVFKNFLNYYGMNHQQGIAIETKAANMTSVYASFLLPNRAEHDIFRHMTANTSAIIMPNSSGFAKLSDARTTLNITPLLTTSDSAFLRTDLTDTSSSKQPQDLDGPITLAYAIEDTSCAISNTPEGEVPDYTKLIVIGDTFGLSPDYINVEATGNQNFISSCLGWLLSINTNYAIEGKTEITYGLKTLSSMSTLLINLFIVGVMPLGVIITGIIVWLKRRHA